MDLAELFILSLYILYSRTNYHFTSCDFLHMLLCCKMFESVLPGDFILSKGSVQVGVKLNGITKVGIKSVRLKKSIHHPSFHLS